MAALGHGGLRGVTAGRYLAQLHYGDTPVHLDLAGKSACLACLIVSASIEIDASSRIAALRQSLPSNDVSWPPPHL